MPGPCPYCRKVRNRQECIDSSMARGVLPACASGPRDDASEEEKSKFRAWISANEDEQYTALVAQQNRLLEGLKAINEERTRRGMLPTCMFKVLAPELGVFNDPVRTQGGNTNG